MRQSLCGKSESLIRSEGFIDICSLVSLQWPTSWFARVRSVAIKDQTKFGDFNLMSPESEAHFAHASQPWPDRDFSVHGFIGGCRQIASLSFSKMGHKWGGVLVSQ
ncbi:hypothetical protein FCV25MIE_01395 [Fagus crenata]